MGEYKLKQRNCKECGADIIHRGKNAIYCKKCTRKRSNRATKRYNRKRYLKNKDDAQYKKKVTDYQKKYSKLKIKIINMLKEHYNISSTQELYEKLKNSLS